MASSNQTKLEAPRHLRAATWLDVLDAERDRRELARLRFEARPASGGMAALGVVLIVVAVLAAMVWVRI